MLYATKFKVYNSDNTTIIENLQILRFFSKLFGTFQAATTTRTPTIQYATSSIGFLRKEVWIAWFALFDLVGYLAGYLTFEFTIRNQHDMYYRPISPYASNSVGS